MEPNLLKQLPNMSADAGHCIHCSMDLSSVIWILISPILQEEIQ